jgi:hypothetical protein
LALDGVHHVAMVREYYHLRAGVFRPATAATAPACAPAPSSATPAAALALGAHPACTPAVAFLVAHVADSERHVAQPLAHPWQFIKRDPVRL